MGGEPLLNPDICKWISGLSKLWPVVQILTNGTRLTKTPGLYDTIGSRSWIGITIHRQDDVDDILQQVRQFLRPPIVETCGHDHHTGSQYQFIDAGKRKVFVWVTDTFVSSNIIPLSGNRYKFYNSNPDTAHANCTFSKFKNYHMIRGKIYKCGPVALMPEFAEQHDVDLDAADRMLLNSYQPLSVDQFDTNGKDFFASIDHTIPQCKFCPEQYQSHKIEFSNLKKTWKINTNENTTQ